MVLDGQFKPGKIIVVAFILQRIDVISVIEDELQLSGAACLVQQVLGELFTLLWQLLILSLKLILHLAELLQLPAELKCSKEWVLAG